MQTFKPFYLILPLFMLLTSCVSYQKYEDLQADRDRLQSNYDDISERLENARAEYQALQDEQESLQKELQETRKDLQVARERYEQLNSANEDLLARYDRMLEQNQQMLESSSDERSKLLAELSRKQQELDRRERELQRLEQQVEQREEDAEQLRADLKEREQRVNELEAAIAEKEARLASLKNTINQALLGFSDTDLSVREENGKVYVSLSQNLLFPSGSKSINAEGRKAIGKVAEVLKANPDIAITVEGHTDTDGDAAFNWDLSVGRATSVVKVLTANGVDPTRITAAGRGEFYPVASNDTAAGKAKNRRTEIILTPKLDLLYQIIEE